MYHPVVDKILNLLKENSCWYETFEHEPVRTSEEAAKLRTGYTLQQGAKAMIVRVKAAAGERKFVMFVLPGDRRFDKKKIKEQFGLTVDRFALESEVPEIAGGVLPGGVPAFGNLFGLRVYADKGIFENEKMIFNAGDRSFSVAMTSEDYRRLVNPTVGSFAI